MSASSFGQHVVLNGRVIAAADACVSPLGDGFMFGLGLFETMKVLSGRIAFFREHMGRLRRSAAALGLALGSSDEELRRRCDHCIAANHLRDAALKLVIHQGAGGTEELIVPRALSYPDELYARGYRLQTTADGGRDPWLCGHKTLNYLKCIRAKRAAEVAGFDEALFVDDAGAVLEGAITTVFAVKDGVVHTPSLAHGILPGVARAAVLRALPAEGAREGTLSREALLAADEVFVTNSLMGVMPVSRVDDRGFAVERASVTARVAEIFRQEEARSLAS